MNNNISRIWNKLGNAMTGGLVKQLYSSDVKFHVFGTFQYPEKYYGIALTIGCNQRADISSFRNLREISVILIPDRTFPDSNLLIVQLLNPEYRDIFAYLCENLIQSVLKSNNEREVIQKVMNQLGKWKALFDKNASTELTTTEQQGLFGELHFLHKLLLESHIIAEQILHFWVGTDKALRDFQGRNWALEVKTSSTNNFSEVIINGERQLDETFFDDLFIFHISVETSKYNGITLCQKITDIRRILTDNITNLSIFNAKLFEAGYSDKQAPSYMDKCYQIRNENYYKVEGNFPRIKEKDLRNGVSEVKYSINLSRCDQYYIPQNKVFNIISEI